MMISRLLWSTTSWLVAVMLAACGDDSAPATSACGTNCDNDDGIGADDDDDDDDDAEDAEDEPDDDDCQTGDCEDHGGWDTDRPPCGGQCASFQECIDEVCLPAPPIEDCAGEIQFARLDVELPTASADGSLDHVYSVDLGLGDGDDLMLTYSNAIVLVPHDGIRPPFEVVEPPDTSIGQPIVGEVSGDDIPDLLVPVSSFVERSSEMVVYVGDGEGGFTPGPSLSMPSPSVRTLLARDVDGDGHDEVFVEVGLRLHWLALEGDTLVDQGDLGPASTSADWSTTALRFDDMGQAELWLTNDDVRVLRGPSWIEESFSLPVPSTVLAPLHARYTGRTLSDALIVSSWQDRLYVVLGERADDLHAVQVSNSSFIPTAGDLDGDGQDDLMLGWQAILGLDEGTSDDPFAGACSAVVNGIEDDRIVYARHIDGGPQVVGWGSGPAASLYDVASTP